MTDNKSFYNIVPPFKFPIINLLVYVWFCLRLYKHLGYCLYLLIP